MATPIRPGPRIVIWTERAWGSGAGRVVVPEERELVSDDLVSTRAGSIEVQTVVLLFWSSKQGGPLAS